MGEAKLPDYLRVVESRSPQEMSDEELVEAGVDAIFKRYAGYVGSIALKMMGRREEVDDVVQDVFLEAHLKLHQLRKPGALRVWLGRITVRKVKRRLRKRRVKQFVGLDDSPRAVDPGASPEACVLLEEVFGHLDSVPAKERIAWTLRILEGATVAEIAEICGCSTSTVKRRVGRAQEKLDRILR